MNKLLMIAFLAITIIVATSNMWAKTPEMCLSMGVPVECSLFVD